ncbi:hypothetical protein [Ornithinibacillus sp. FSL M8-0202]|uniref:hypothetical protein n=1 Tax=unclassified Ornithinibacillus TaxID=2620869 RepID=UPI0030CB40EE
MKKFILTVCIILLLISIYKDLNTGTNISKQNESQDSSLTENTAFEPIKIKTERGDTVLSVTERLNPTIHNINIEQIRIDFSTLNPTVDPDQLQVNRYYFFPKYNGYGNN